MPTYEYGCSAGHRYELAQGFDAEPTHQCMEAPKGTRCEETAQRVISLAAVIFKGVGWGKDPYRERVWAGQDDPQDVGYKTVSDSVKEED